ncbi:DUF1501 domain-containing protein [Zavarzinella formosa]|uniref:DUF1501 domain-containing protein n=1 Tax=Zavarzinella formosa TaxID=360055 RepID=UPI0002F75698|nr:DUF1501 domain-containing protein [Zavarzinella formosa]
MLRVLGHATRACDGLTRRELLTAGTMAMAGLVPGVASPAKPGGTFGQAKSVILLDLFGGPSHIDTFDPKPDAPAEIRGEFGTIPTAIPGVRFTEHVPMLAKRLDRFCLIRTLSHVYNSHNPYAVMTGFTGGNDRENYYAKPTDHPGMGAVCQYFGVGQHKGLPGYVCLPAYPGYSQGLRRAGPFGGYLGSQFNPMFSTCDPKWDREIDANKDFYNHLVKPIGVPQLPKLTGDLTINALDSRRSLLTQIDQLARGTTFQKQREQAFDLLLSPAARTAFDMDRESHVLRDRYGRDLFGSSTLMARRLVEAGSTFVMVHTEAKGNGHWDTHDNNFNMLKHWLLPYLDRAVSALLDDLEARGMMDSTLVVVMGDMGRMPKVNARAGRDHWTKAGFALLFGAGIRPGTVFGSTDSQAAFPKDHPVSPGDMCATIYHLLGVDPESTVPDHTGRPTHISHGGGVINPILV